MIRRQVADFNEPDFALIHGFLQHWFLDGNCEIGPAELVGIDKISVSRRRPLSAAVIKSRCLKFRGSTLVARNTRPR
jgi:hypothetical protein